MPVRGKSKRPPVGRPLWRHLGRTPRRAGGPPRALVFQGVAGGFLRLPELLLNLTFDLVGLTVGLKLGVAGHLADGILDRAASLLGAAFDLVLVHDAPPLGSAS